MIFLTANNINSYLNSKREILIFDTLSSTNDYAKENAEKLNDGSLIIAKTQTAGRGRMNRYFFSPDKTGIYMSLFLKPYFKAKKYFYITVAAAVAVRRAIEKLFQTTPTIKWVNDIYINDKKVCGILTEAVTNGNKSFAVLGIGINLKKPIDGFPSDINNKAGYITSVSDIETKEKLIAEIINNFDTFYKNIEEKEFMDDYRRFSYLDGKTVEYTKNGITHTAEVLGIDAEAGLLVSDGKTTQRLFTGEVSVKPKAE